MRVAVTGIGAVSALGLGAAATWDGLAAGRAGIGPITRFDASGFAVRLAGEVRGALPGLPDAVAAVATRDPKVGFGWLACREALAQAGIDRLGGDDELHLGVSLEIFDPAATVSSGRADFAAAAARVRAGGPPIQTPLDSCTRLVAASFGVPARTLVDCSACTASAQAIGLAFRAVRTGRARRALCGGCDSLINPLALGGFHMLGALATGTAGCRPFDRDRSGTVLGEGAAALVLEGWDAARARGAAILGEVLGYGSSLDAVSLSAPDREGRGAQAAMRACLADARLAPADVGQLSAHGTGTILNDEAEAVAVRAVFADVWPRLPVTAIKSMTGHGIAAAGGLQAVACLHALRDGRLPPNIGLGTVAAGCELAHVGASGIRHDGRPALANTFGFGGQNACLLYGGGDA